MNTTYGSGITQNGVKAPSADSVASTIWRIFDRMRPTTYEDALWHAKRKGRFNENNVKREFASWKKFNGV